MAEQTLNQELNALEKRKLLPPEVEKSILQNLNPKFVLRPYQEQAFKRFQFQFTDPDRSKPLQLLFHMATGSGKTLIMAGLMTYLYEKGYRNFIFFVNNKNIITKTRENFLSVTSPKYLFTETVKIRDAQIRIKEVENFEAANQEDINIVFTTIQGLHSRLTLIRENSITPADFKDKKTIMISDEAHHINSLTKNFGQLKSDEKLEVASWEGTVNSVFNANKENILLEFTATVDLSHSAIKEKYDDKLLFDYPLKKFREDGYSKDIKILQADLSHIERALQAVILNQYRLKLFEANKIHIKPVILFKSKTIKESEEFFEQFIQTIRKLKVADIEKIIRRIPEKKKDGQADSYRALRDAFNFFDSKKISLENLVLKLKEDFSEDKCIAVNSNDQSEEKQVIVNTLEAEHNEYRAVFAVDKLNEGWDVLNLFDIVRLYDTRDAREGKPGTATMAEAQLIGRGARYCPFQLSAEQLRYNRKYDKDLSNPMRACEELYYHSKYNSRYVDELNKALEETGAKAKNTVDVTHQLKLDFIVSDFYKEGLIYLNDVAVNDFADVYSLDKDIIEKKYNHSLQTGFIQESQVFDKSKRKELERKPIDVHFKDISKTILRKALQRIDFFRFSNLKKYFPHLTSITEFITSDAYLNKIKVEVKGTEEQVKNISPQQLLEISEKVLELIATEIPKDKFEHTGTPEFTHRKIYETFTDKEMSFVLDDGGTDYKGYSMNDTKLKDLALDLSNKDWYVYTDNFGTSEERKLIHFINKANDSLKKKYEKVYLIRNEQEAKIYSFKEGRPFYPDFVLFLQTKGKKDSIVYQLFIEPKGRHLVETDSWKEDFLKEIEATQKIVRTTLFENRQYKLIGLPFYNEEVRLTEFENEFLKLNPK